jgi:hypothetical protein
MTIQQAADKWGFSVNWVRHLVKTGKVRAEARTDPVPHYWIKPNHPIPDRERKRGAPEAPPVKVKAAKVAPVPKAKAKRAPAKARKSA